MFQKESWPSVILHVDGDAFFASVIQAVKPHLKGKPLAVGRERGICTAISYEARKRGVVRGMRPFEIKKICPECIILDSDYHLYSQFSEKMFSILRSFTPLVEEYSIDEAFADIQDLSSKYNQTYEEIGRTIKNKIESSLGITVSLGISLTKTLAKLASSYRKPSGLTVIEGRMIEGFLEDHQIEDVWGIGRNTGIAMRKVGISNPYSFAIQRKEFIEKFFDKPQYEIWQELRGTPVYSVSYEGKHSYKSMGHTRTFTPSIDPTFLWGRILYHVEEVFSRARQYNYMVGKVYLFLKTQQFEYHSTEIKLCPKTAFPYLIREELQKAFLKIYKKRTLYRSAGCYIADLTQHNLIQHSLFEDLKKEKKLKAVYPLYDQGKIDFGTSFFVHGKKQAVPLQLPFLKISI